MYTTRLRPSSFYQLRSSYFRYQKLPPQSLDTVRLAHSTTEPTASTSTAKMTSKSAEKLIPPNPSKVMVIRDLDPRTTTFSSPFARFGLIKVGGRATLIKLQTGNLAVFSPVSLTPEVKAKVAEKGNLKYIVAPDIEHHIHLTTWSKEWPDAEVIGMEGLPEKRELDEATKGLKFAHVFTKSNKNDMKISPEFDAEFDHEYIDAHQNKELVFCHRPTKTLIEADLFFNLPATEQYSKADEAANAGILTKIGLFFFGGGGEMTGQRRLLWYGPGGKDRASFAASARKIHGWNYDRVIPCHGDVVETGGKETIDHLTGWFRDLK